MARGSSPVAQYAVLGVLGLVAWNWAVEQPAGSAARKTADELRHLLHGTKVSAPATPGGAPQSAAPQAAAPAAPATPSGPIFGGQSDAQQGGVGSSTSLPSGFSGFGLNLWDFGNQQLAYDQGSSTVMQLFGTNTYGPGDVFHDGNGRQWQYQGGIQLVAMDNGETSNVFAYDNGQSFVG